MAEKQYTVDVETNSATEKRLKAYAEAYKKAAEKKEKK